MVQIHSPRPFSAEGPPSPPARDARVAAVGSALRISRESANSFQLLTSRCKIGFYFQHLLVFLSGIAPLVSLLVNVTQLEMRQINCGRVLIGAGVRTGTQTGNKFVYRGIELP